MKKFLEALNKICIDYPLRPKFVFVPNLGIAQELLHAFAKVGYGFLNLQVVTMSTFAKDHMDILLSEQQLQLVETPLPEQICLEVLKTLKQKGKLTYYNKLPITLGVSRTVYRSIFDLKMAGLTGRSLSIEKFVDGAKGEDLALILDGYDHALRNRSFVDQADVLQLALENSSSNQEGLYLMPSNLRTMALEKQFLNQISGGNYLELEFDSRSTVPTVEKENLEILQSYGEENEMRVVLRRIFASGCSLDQTAVFYSSREPYVERFADLAEALQIPVTFGEGIDSRTTTSGRLFLCLLEWVKNNFAASTLLQLFRDGLIKAEAAPSYYALAKLLEEAGIRWGRARYRERLEMLLLEVEASSADEEYKESKNERIRWVLRFCETLLRGLPVTWDSGPVSMSQIATWLSRQLKSYTPIHNGRDAEALVLLRETLKRVGSMQLDPLNVDEAIERLEFLAEELRVDVSVSKPGHLHVDSYRNGAWIMRESSFVMGLDAGRSPGQVLEDPILLDIERSELSEHLPTSLDFLEEKGEGFAHLVNNAAHLTLSYSCFDVLEHREELPSSSILRIYRSAFEKPHLSYTDLKKALPPVESYI